MSLVRYLDSYVYTNNISMYIYIQYIDIAWVDIYSPFIDIDIVLHFNNRDLFNRQFLYHISI